jgi:hypothetical protein
MLCMEKSNSFYAIFSLLGAIAFCLPVILWMSNPQFSGLWILYVGNFSLMVVVFISEAVYGGRIRKPGLKALFTTGMKVALLSILLSLNTLLINIFACSFAAFLAALTLQKKNN